MEEANKNEIAVNTQINVINFVRKQFILFYKFIKWEKNVYENKWK